MNTNSKNSKFGIWLVVIILVVGVALIATLKMIPVEKKEVEKQPTPAVNVSVMKVTPVDKLQETMTHKAVIEPWTSITLSAETSAAITSIEAAEGDSIKAGQLLVKLNDDLLGANYEKARQQAELDQREAERMLNAAASSTASEKDAAKSKAATSYAAMQYAEAELVRTKISAPKTIRDPHPLMKKTQIIGVLDNIPVEIGEYVQPGTNVATIVDTSALKVIVNCPERDINYVHVGDMAEVIVEALGDKKLTGKVHFIESTADKATLTYRVEIMIENIENLIRPGMFARVTLNRRLIDNAIMIPLDAAIPMEQDYEVYICEDGFARKRLVYLKGDLIRSNADGVAEILCYEPRDGQGLKPDDMLIIRGQRLLADGQKVTVQNVVGE